MLKKLERILEKIEESQATPTMLQSIMESIVQGYGPEIGITAGRLYEQTNSHYQLISQVGDSHAPESYEISMEYEPIQILRREGQAFVRSTDPEFDAKVEGPLGITSFAAISVGDNDEFVISFTLMEPVKEDHVHYALTTIRHVANLRMRTRRLEGYIAEARKIQLNLLPKEFPKFFDFDIHGRSLPAEIVGGDVFDIIPISDATLGLVIADASGHGLPAALQVRDVIVGLRMGIEKDLKIVRTIQKLNSVLGQADKSHNFISMFYAEVEDNGNFFYVNAGHPPALFFGNTAVHELNRGGLIMGPYPKAKYERGFVFFEKGNLVVMYTDGVTEATNMLGEEFGTDRIKEIVEGNREASCKELCDLIFKAVEEHTEAAPPKDDRTVLVLKKTT